MIVDTGPLLATLDVADQDHRRCAQLLNHTPGPLRMPAPVLTEVCYMLERGRGAAAEAAFLRSLARGEIELVTLLGADLERMADLTETYADLPLGAVDAAVIAIAERLGEADVATLDRRHFTVVRPAHVEAFTLYP